MLVVDIPGFRTLRLEHLVLDFNGTLAIDGRMIDGVATRLRELSNRLRIQVITADTFGRAAQELAGLPLQLAVLGEGDHADAKLDLVTRLGADSVVAVGNGRNDRKMVAIAALGIAVLQREGAASETLAAATILASDIRHALDLLAQPRRLVATLRS